MAPNMLRMGGSTHQFRHHPSKLFHFPSLLPTSSSPTNLPRFCFPTLQPFSSPSPRITLHHASIHLFLRPSNIPTSSRISSYFHLCPRRSLFDDDADEIRFMPQIVLLSWVSVLWDIACGLWRLPRTIWGLLTGNESTVREVEEKLDEAAKLVKKAATEVEKTAKEVEKVAEVVEEDADKVETMLDKVEKTSETMKEEMKEAVGDVKESMDTLKEATEAVEKSTQEVANKINDVMEPKTTPPPSTTSTPSSDVSKFSSTHFQWLLLLLNPFHMDINPSTALLFRYTIAFALTVWQVVFLRSNTFILSSP